MNIGKLIKENRKKLNMTQKELAQTLGISHITVCRWETNFIVPTNYNWIVLQNLFGLRKDNLIMPTKGFAPVKVRIIKPLKKLKKINKIAERNKQIIENYKKGIPIEYLAKFYSIKQNTIKSILLSQKIKLNVES